MLRQVLKSRPMKAGRKGPLQRFTKTNGEKVEIVCDTAPNGFRCEKQCEIWTLTCTTCEAQVKWYNRKKKCHSHGVRSEISGGLWMPDKIDGKGCRCV
jgi:hypothetical protein